MNTKKCINCGKTFKPVPQAPKQTYCAATTCQKERRKKWQKNKLQTDPDYKKNQASAQKAWANRNRDYWRKYRESEKNQGKQTLKDNSTHNDHFIKMDLSSSWLPFTNGLFKLKLIANNNSAKIDSWIIEITRYEEAFNTNV